MSDLRHNKPMPLKKACAEFFDNSITAATMRSAHRKGLLVILKIGNTDQVTPSAIRDWLDKCQKNTNRQDSTSTEKREPGLSATDLTQSALDAMNMSANELKKGSPNTSRKNTRRKCTTGDRQK